MARINLLPWREKLRKKREKEFYIACGGVAGIAIFLLIAFQMQISSLIGKQEIRNQFLTQQIANLDQQIENIKSLETEKARLLARMNVIQTLQQSRPEIIHLFEEVVSALPDGVYLTNVDRTENNIKIEGVAESNARISNFMRNLDASSWLQDPELIVINSDIKELPNASVFTLNIKRTIQNRK